MAETLLIDPVTVAINRIEWDITQYVAEAGPDWGDAAIEQYLADAEQGSIPVDFRIPSRTITIPLLLLKSREVDALTFAQVRSQFQQKAALFQREGGWIGRSTSIGTVYADVTGATLKFGGSTAQALWGIDADAVLTLTCLPDWYGDEVWTDFYDNFDAAGDLIFTISDIPGDMPARARLYVNEGSGVDHHGLLWGLRCRNYSSEPTAALALEAEALTPIAPATIVTGAFAALSGNKEVSISTLANDWTAVLSTDMPGQGSLTHSGSYRVWARVRTGATVKPPKVRLVWDVGDLVLPVENTSVRLPLAYNNWLADLGTIRLDPAPIGPHRWQGVIQAADGDGLFAIDKIWLQPLDEAAGRLSNSLGAPVGLKGRSVYDGFDQTAGALTGKALPVGGGVWTFVSGDTDDFTVDATNHWAQRNATADTAPRRVIANAPVMTATAAQIDFNHPTPVAGGNQEPHLIFRYVDANNFAYVRLYRSNGHHWMDVETVLGGTFGTWGASLDLGVVYDAWWTLRVAVTVPGYVFVWLFPQGASQPSTPTYMIYAPNVFGPASPLASGKVGFADYTNVASVATRLYDNFMAWVPDADAVLFTGRFIEIRFDGMYREAVDGYNYAPVSIATGDNLRLPPSGMESRTTEVFLRPSFGDLDRGADQQMLWIQAQMGYRPCYLFVP